MVDRAPNRRWQFSVTSLLAAMLLIALVLGWLHERSERKAVSDRFEAAMSRVLLKIDHPLPKDRFDIRSNIAVMVEVLLPLERDSAELLRVHARLYRVENNDLQLVVEAPGRRMLEQHGVASFAADFKSSARGSGFTPGKHVISIECFDEFGALLAANGLTTEIVDGRAVNAQK